MTVATSLNFAPLPGCKFGRVVSGFDPAQQTEETMKEVQDALYRVSIARGWAQGAADASTTSWCSQELRLRQNSRPT